MDTAFLDDPRHGSADCADCHGGDPTGETRAVAHVGMIPDPTVENASGACGSCHASQVTLSGDSLHTTLAGIRHSLAVRSGGEPLGPELQTAFTNHCARCHSSCGDCHVSVPAAAGGGLLAKHQFRRTPSMNLVCTACHGSRVGDEYKGLNAGVPADTHYNRGLQCTSCHSGAEMHGDGSVGVAHRYEVSSAPRCTDCHPDDSSFTSTMAHTMHRDATTGELLLSCQVCHAVQYKNCTSCHVSLDSSTGAPVYEVNAPTYESLMTFKIGLNPQRDALHPAKWVTLRHVPVDPDNFAHYGDGLLSSYDAQSTWRLATPHNIQRVTPQSSGCTSTCHGHRELFLAPEDLAPYEVDANQAVVVPDTDLP